MTDCRNKIFFGSLLALCVAALGNTATAMDLVQSETRKPASPSFTLPSFLGDAQLPDLQRAWKAGESEPTTAPGPEVTAAEPDSAPSDGGATPTAHVDTQGAEETDLQAQSVRQRAEELSQRFGSEAGADANDGSETASIDAVPAPSAAGQALDKVESAAIEVPERRSAGAVNAPGLSPARRTQIPSARRLGAVIAKERSVEAPDVKQVALPKTERTSQVDARAKPPAKKSEEASAPMPTELGAFGWDSRDQLD